MKIIFTDSNRSMKVCSKCQAEMKFSIRNKLYIERTGSLLAFGLSQEK